MKLDVIYTKDCLVEMPKRLPNESIDLMACDPQYGWNFMGRDWDKAVPSIDIWRQCFRVLKPGAFAFIMSGPRLDCLIENGMRIREAGFVISFTPIFWAFASGFPKAQNIGKAVDKKARRDYVQAAIKLGIRPKDFKRSLIDWTKEEHTPSNKYWEEFKKVISREDWKRIEREITSKDRTRSNQDNVPFTSRGEFDRKDKPATPQAQALDGSYGGFQPKPAVEVIIVAMKPLSEKTYVDQALQNKKGVTWLDEGRIPYEGRKDKESARYGTQMDIRNNNYMTPKGVYAKNVLSSTQGRFPANLLVSDDVLNDGRTDKGTKPHKVFSQIDKYQGWGSITRKQGEIVNYGDSGSFFRYFSLDSWFNKRLKELPQGVQKTFPFLIVPKASKAEKNRGCEGLYWEKDNSSFGYHQVGRQRWEWLGKEEERIHKETGKRINLRARGNIHPTVKPLKLGSYLITIGSRRGDAVLDPFGGSGWTAIAAKALGRHYIVFETIKENVEIAKLRLSQIQLELL